MDLLSLPNELLSEIVLNTHVSAVFNLAICCRRLYNACQSRLQQCRAYDREWRTVYPDNPFTCLQAVRSIINDGECHWFIRQCQINEGTRSWRDWEPYLASGKASQFAYGTSLTRQQNIYSDRDWWGFKRLLRDTLPQDCRDSELEDRANHLANGADLDLQIMFVSQLARPFSLIVAIWGDETVLRRLYSIILGRAAMSGLDRSGRTWPPGLWNLKELHVKEVQRFSGIPGLFGALNHLMGPEYRSLGCLKVPFLLPNLQKLRYSASLDPLWESPVHESLYSAKSSIQHLDLSRQEIRVDVALWIIDYCAALHSCAFQLRRDPTLPKRPSHICQEALHRRHAKTLTHLQLLEPNLDNLSGFRKLEEVLVTLKDIAKRPTDLHDKLPPSVSFLQVVSSYTDGRRYADDVANLFPALQHLVHARLDAVISGSHSSKFQPITDICLGGLQIIHGSDKDDPSGQLSIAQLCEEHNICLHTPASKSWTCDHDERHAIFKSPGSEMFWTHS